MQAVILTFIIPAIAMIFAAVFAGLWWVDRKSKHIAAFSYCYASLALGVMINILIFRDVGPLGIVSYHLLSMSGLIALLWGTAHRMGLQVPIRAYVATVLLTVCILWVAADAGERTALLMAQNVNSSLLMALTAQNLWHAGSRRIADRAVIWVLALFATFGFIRPQLSIFSDALFGPGEAGAAMLLSLHVLVLAIFLTVQALTLIATIIADRSETDREQAAIDPLSGLPMRAMFERQALAMEEAARLQGTSLCLIIADIDHFKRINDTHGHASGDRVIARFGSLISGAIRPHDICGRIGGEEFCMLAFGCEAEQAQALADRVRIAAKEPIGLGADREVTITASFGVAQWAPHEQYMDVFKRADAALYEAKRQGRDRVVLGLVDGGERVIEAPEPEPVIEPATVVALPQRKAGQLA